MKIVAPAGNMERFYSAISATADEIYLGLKGFGARRNAENFTVEGLKKAIDYAHLRGSRIFLTLNTIMTNREIELLYPTLKDLYNYGLDAIIVQDLGYAEYLHKNFPSIELHGSTQMTVANYYEINYLKELGFKRIVLPRELSFEEIKEIRKHTDIELEVFVSGSLCISFSGNCYMSSFIGGRSGNRGMCAQPCRKEYKTSCGEKSYFLSPKDQLYGIDEIKKLQEIGVESIKVEGRMKDVSYVYETVSYFRSLINGIDKEENTHKLFNRGYSKGYFYDNDKNIMNRDYSYNMGEKIGEVIGKNIRLDEDIVSGDGITFVSKDYKNLGGTYINKIAYKNEKLILNFPDGTKYIFRNYNKRLNDEISKKLKSTDKKLEINFDFIAKLNEKLILKIYLEDENGNRILNLEEISETLTQKAQKRAISEEDIKEKLSEIGDSEFTVKNIKIDIDKNIFIPLSELKNIKRNAVEKFREKILSYFRRDLDRELKENNQEYFRLELEKDEPKDLEIRVIVSNEEQKNFLENIKNEYNIKEIYYRTYDIAKQSKLSQHNLNNKLASNLYELLENKNSDVMLNWNMNIVNSYTINVLEKIKKLESFIISPEINFSKIRELGKTRLKKALLIYSKLKGMTIDIDLTDNKNEVITNKENDKFSIIRNEYGTEIFLDKPLNIINIIEDIKKLNVDIVVLEFTTETIEDIKKVLKQLKTRKGEYREYNYKRGVY
ncbi:peptidase U32 family protein [Fusobacterium nucleatum]|uniref:Peptidase, U32 family n=3 Tax=Fusobacterium nucleatum TaxID=851 RepID=A0A133PB55_FUSNU|nr:U32 family peptidase [Fusobacterium nucleatum]KXA25760.1 peptidase, U32 family [Fusobacterium nucleatum]MCL4575385.1 protease [Fusobacterium nucleatum YWH7056]MCL4593078.1 protease [Fusobacterium nucleatum YWH7053]